MGRYRLLIFGLIGGLLSGLALLVAELPPALERLSTAQSDNTRWTILQVETEVSNLAAALASGDGDDVRLRGDILLSRIGLVQAGQGRALFASNDEAQEILARLAVLAEAFAHVLDATPELSAGARADLVAISGDMRPDIRRLAVLGLSEGARQGDARRAQLYHQLRRIGTTAIALITCLLVMLVIVERLLSNLTRQARDLRSSSNRLAATVSGSLDGILIFDEGGEIVAFNRSAERIFGWTGREVIGRNMHATLFPPGAQILPQAGPERVELTALRRSGETFPIELNLTTAPQETGDLHIVYLRDISDRKLNEARLIEARDQAERMDRAKTRLLAVVSHEMRTPLNGIVGVLDLLRTTSLSEKQTEYVEIATASGEILLEQVNEALDVARLETGDLSLALQAFDLEELVANLVRVLRPLAREKGLRLRMEIDPAMARMFLSDGGRIRQILTNLIGNAIKFSTEGEILVTVGGIVGPQLTTGVIRVADQGPGIPADQIDRIFEDFVQLQAPGGRQTRNDGLGLSIARRLARKLEGTLEVESTPGAGSTFILSLPLEPVADPAGSGIAAQNPAAKSVLIVEDNAVNRSILREMLVKLGHRVAEAETGIAALAATDRQRFDLIIMDISMPEMDGIEATRRIRGGTGPNRDTCILGLSAHGRDEFRAPALAAGMDRFCTKPIRFSVLRAQLDGACAGADAASEEIDAEVAGDLLQALGGDKTRKAAEQFLAELAEGVAVLKSLTPDEDGAAISEHLHRLRGGAVLLGLRGIARRIDGVSAAARAGQGYGAQLELLSGRLPGLRTVYFGALKI